MIISRSTPSERKPREAIYQGCLLRFRHQSDTWRIDGHAADCAGWRRPEPDGVRRWSRMIVSQCSTCTSPVIYLYMESFSNGYAASSAADAKRRSSPMAEPESARVTAHSLGFAFEIPGDLPQLSQELGSKNSK